MNIRFSTACGIKATILALAVAYLALFAVCARENNLSVPVLAKTVNKGESFNIVEIERGESHESPEHRRQARESTNWSQRLTVEPRGGQFISYPVVELNGVRR